jgi:hypothetical protein
MNGGVGNGIHNNSKASKLGRKGDPRMHRAVTARLENPNLTLYEALRIGGFEYPKNDDASLIDSEKVTLGQRKNQLSRRLRLARKNHGGGGGGSSEGKGGDSEDESMERGSTSFRMQQQQFRRGGAAVNHNSGRLPTGMSINVGDVNNNNNNNNDMSMSLSMDTQHEINKLMMNSTSKPPAQPTQMVLPNNSLGARALQMKRDADFTLDDSDLVAPETPNDNNHGNSIEEQSKRPRIAKFHPDFAHLIVPPASFRGAAAAAANASAATNNFDSGGGTATNSINQNIGHPFQVRQPNSMPNVGSGNAAAAAAVAASAMNMGSSPFTAGNLMGAIASSNFASGPFFNHHFTNPFSGQSFLQSQQPRASAVAVSSLTSTAQAVGLTLEQLALALSSNTTNLAKLVAETRSGESMAKQQELALNLFETESKSLYTKCMLMAGIDASLAQPDTPTYMGFALKAWQAEGKRLQDMMSAAKRESTGIDPSDLSVGDPPTNPKVGNNDSESDDASHDSDGHDHGHDHDDDDDDVGGANEISAQHDSSKCDARHVHRLGQCGHRAIIHQPKDGAAHIDFIVNDQVECYSGLNSVPLGTSVDSAWPSKYKCKEVEESGTNACGKNIPGADTASESGGSEPKILRLSEINLQDPEWNYDASGYVDGGVMGLFKLGGYSSS